MNKWQRINYQPNLPLGDNGERVTACSEHRLLSKNAAKEGMVLLKNNNNLLPLSKGSKVALFGKATFDYVKGGGGSGDVTVEYIKTMYDGMKELSSHVSVFEELADFYRSHVVHEYAKGKEPGLTIEPTLSQEIINKASAFADTAIITFCRFSGEGWDRKSSDDPNEVHAESWVAKYAIQANELFDQGDFYLSSKESELVENVKKNFKNIIVVMNVGGMVDSTWFKEDEAISSVLMSWQGGMEGGCATAELLCGIGNPSGKLVDSFAKNLQDYPSTYNYHESDDYVDYTDDIYVGYRYFETIPGASEKVNYPFGFGMSYTNFERSLIELEEENGVIEFKIQITNTGKMPGKDIVQLYAMPPQGLLGKPAKNLIAFSKTRLLKVGEMQQLMLTIDINDLASYDDLGKIQKSAFVLEKGDYEFFIGSSSRDGVVIDYKYKIKEDTIVKQMSEKLAPKQLNKRMIANGSFEELTMTEANDPDMSVLNKREPNEIDGYAPLTRFKDISRLHPPLNNKTLLDVYEGSVSMDGFIAGLSDDELAHLLGGQPNTTVANTFGFGNLPEHGIPNVMTADGPAGLRINKECGVNTTAWPCSTLLASSWNPEIVFEVGEAGAREVKENNIGIWLTPAVNIHRSPLCGRNFEYYSEDPLVAGKLAAAMVRGIQSVGVSATVKHFAFNNKECNRKNSDSRVSERAAREIYLKAFEIIVKEADPWCIMSSYNLVNGHRASANRELLEDILRKEWGFNGTVTTDWWTYGEHYKEVMAGNDVKMACGYPERLLEAVKLGALKREDMEVSVKRILELIIKLD